MDRRLLAVGLGTFHALLFFVSLVLLLHLNAGLDALLRLGTGVGVLVFLVFWMVTVWSTAMALDGVAEGGDPLKQAALWGAAEGFILLALLLITIGILESWVVFTVFPLGSAFAVAIGALVGLVFAALDRLLLGSPMDHLQRPEGERQVSDPVDPLPVAPGDPRHADENDK